MGSVNILGTDYLVETDTSLNDGEKDGLCYPYSKKITTRDKGGVLDEFATDEEKEIRLQEVKRHEIIHAFFHESGLDEYCENEQLVDWFAIQSPKIFKVFQELNIL